MAEVDLTDILDGVIAPTLLIHPTDDRMVPVGQSRYLAARLPNARLVEVPSTDHLPFLSHPEIVMGEIQRHLLGDTRPAASPRRQFATVLFTDIADSSPTVLPLPSTARSRSSPSGVVITTETMPSVTTYRSRLGAPWRSSGSPVS